MQSLLVRLVPIFTCAALVTTGVVLRERTPAARPAAILETWSRVDRPVETDQVARTWLWGPQDTSFQRTEQYADSPGGKRTVVYFDKSRMEISDPNADPGSSWFVANGLLVVELTSGSMQVGDSDFVQRAPAAINVAGDPDDSSGPTYATFGGLTSAAPTAEGATIAARLARDGTLSDEAQLAEYGVTAAHRVTVNGIDHTIAAPFWAFMNSRGLVFEDDHYQTDQLFPDVFYATGYPISEAYWARVTVLGTSKDVLIQCFERRCLTYTPDNPDGWKVEAGNVGQHYFTWRYGAR
jgi:hypothetical protein